MPTLWKKSFGSAQDKSATLHPVIEAYTVGEDPMLDMFLFPFDIEASMAHAKGLKKIGILNGRELQRLLFALKQLLHNFSKGKLKISVQDEDCHTVIENALTKKLGSIGKKIHTGRSRNDQVLVALRLFMKDRAQLIRKKALLLAEHFLSFAKKYEHVPLPGYTHMQQAMLGSIGHFGCSFAEALLDDISLLDTITKHIDANPLGSAAGYGVALPLDRDGITKELTFSRTQINSLYCQNSRGKFESVFLEGLTQLMMTLGRFANDLLLFTTQEFDFFAVRDSLVTGSSIMPQKRNLDGLEVLRGNVSVVMGYQQMVKDIAKNLPSGYNRDLQLLKRPLIHSTEIVLTSMDVATVYLQGITPKRESIEKKITKDIFMADVATALVTEKGIPFREAYQLAARKMDSYTVDFARNISSKISLGAPGNLGWKQYEKRILEIKLAAVQ